MDTIATVAVFGGASYAVWGVALYSLPTLFLVVRVNRGLNLLDVRREFVVLPALGVGVLAGLSLIYLFY